MGLDEIPRLHRRKFAVQVERKRELEKTVQFHCGDVPRSLNPQVGRIGEQRGLHGQSMTMCLASADGAVCVFQARLFESAESRQFEYHQGLKGCLSVR